jgi:hypothetical protein
VSNLSKLDLLADIEGFKDVDTMLDECIADSVCPGICINDGCDYTTEVEPDQQKGWCELCEEGTVASALVLAGVI